MAALPDVWEAMRASLIAACVENSDAGILDPAVGPQNVMIDYPATNVLQDVARGCNSLVSIFDVPMGRDVTRWAPFNLDPVQVPTLLVSSASHPTIAPISSATITLTHTPGVGDAVSAVIGRGVTQFGAVAIAVKNDTLDILAAKLAANINANTNINYMVLASANGPVVSLLNLTNTGLKLQTFTGNNAVAKRVLSNTEHFIGITCWCQSPKQRRALGKVLKLQIARWMANFGLPLADGTWARLKANSDRPGRDDHLKDLYRWDFLVSAEFSDTDDIPLFAILNPQFIKNTPLAVPIVRRYEPALNQGNFPIAIQAPWGYRVFATADWLTVLKAYYLTSTGFRIDSSTPAPVGSTLGFAALPLATANMSSVATQTDDDTLIISVPTGVLLPHLTLQPSWNTTIWITAESASAISLKFGTPAPPLGSVSYYFNPHSGRQTVSPGALSADVSGSFGDSLPYVVPSWNTEVSVSGDESNIHVVFGTPAPAGAFIHWSFIVL